MNRRYQILVGCGLALLLGACSSSLPSPEGEAEEALPIMDAGTDPVPLASAEEVAPPVDAPPAEIAEAPVPGESLTAPPTLDDPAATAMVAPPEDQTPPAPLETPAPQLAETPPAFSPMQASEGSEAYTVQQGDTLMKIAFETYGDLFKWRQIYEANRDKIQNPNGVPPGTVLMLEKPSVPARISRNGERYMIKEGDTLGSISQDVYGTKTKWKRIWQNNSELIRDPNLIFAGFHLYYTMTTEDREELERYRHEPENQTQPLAKTQEAPADESGRSPSSVPASVPVGQAPPVVNQAAR